MTLNNTPLKTRFAPSPTGYLHLGHVLSAYTAWAWAKANNAQFILRIEDIDTTRCKDIYTDAIMRDLEWLGLDWQGEVIKQSERFELYKGAITTLQNKGLVYPCFTTRKEISNHPHTIGGDGIIYPGIWRNASQQQIDAQMAVNTPYCQRLKIDSAYSACQTHSFIDSAQGTIIVDASICGDVVICRKDVPTSYHISVCLDDNAQGITHIIRGKDLFEQTHIHRILQGNLGYSAPLYTHHDLITDDRGKKFSKSDKSLTIKDLRECGHSPEDVLRMVGIYT